MRLNTLLTLISKTVVSTVDAAKTILKNPASPKQIILQWANMLFSLLVNPIQDKSYKNTLTNNYENHTQHNGIHYIWVSRRSTLKTYDEENTPDAQGGWRGEYTRRSRWMTRRIHPTLKVDVEENTPDAQGGCRAWKFFVRRTWMQRLAWIALKCN